MFLQCSFLQEQYKLRTQALHLVLPAQEYALYLSIYNSYLCILLDMFVFSRNVRRGKLLSALFSGQILKSCHVFRKGRGMSFLTVLLEHRGTSRTCTATLQEHSPNKRTLHSTP